MIHFGLVPFVAGWTLKGTCFSWRTEDRPLVPKEWKQGHPKTPEEQDHPKMPEVASRMLSSGMVDPAAAFQQPTSNGW